MESKKRGPGRPKKSAKVAESQSVAIVESTPQEIAPPVESSAALNLLQMAMTNSEVDLEKMEKIMEMVDKQEAKESVKLYNSAMATLQGELPHIDRDGRILGRDGKVRSNYSKFETIMKAIQPVLTKNGFSISFNPSVKDGKMAVKVVVSHSGGHSEKSTVELPFDDSGQKSKVQEYGSSMSYAKRYAICLKLNIATGGEDNDGNEVEAGRTPEELKPMIDNAGSVEELGILWDSLTLKEQISVKTLFSIRRNEVQ